MKRCAAAFLMSCAVLGFVAITHGQTPLVSTNATSSGGTRAPDWGVATPASELPLRDWTKANGTKVSARLTRLDALRDLVFFQRPDGSTAQTALSRLSEADRAYVAVSLSDRSLSSDGAPNKPALSEKQKANASPLRPGDASPFAGVLAANRRQSASREPAIEERDKEKRTASSKRGLLDFVRFASKSSTTKQPEELPTQTTAPRALVDGLKSSAENFDPEATVYYGCRGTWHIFPRFFGTAAYCYHGHWRLTFLTYSHSNLAYDYYTEWGFNSTGVFWTGRHWAFSRVPSYHCRYHSHCGHGHCCDHHCRKYSVWLFDRGHRCLFDCADRVGMYPY